MSNTKTIMGQASNQYVAPTDGSDLFSTFLYDGTGAAQTITNGIDLTKGGLIITKRRNSSSGGGPWWNDTERGVDNYVQSSATTGQNTGNSMSGVTSSGYTLGTFVGWNTSAAPYVSWTFRKAPKFFDCVTYTGTGSAKTISHNLGSVPGMIIVKRTDAIGDWGVYHRQLNNGTDRGHWRIKLNSTGAQSNQNTFWNDTAPTDSVFTVGTSTSVNASGGTYVAYVFAHNNSDGTFGPTYDQDIIKCGSYTGDGTTDGSNVIDLGWEPQWVMVKVSSTADSWLILDNMRGIGGTTNNVLRADSNGAEEQDSSAMGTLLPNGFSVTKDNNEINGSGQTYIYMAIRRGPLTPPTSGTEVFKVVPPTNTSPVYVSGFTADMGIWRYTASTNTEIMSRITGKGRMYTNLTNGSGDSGSTDWDYMDGWYNDYINQPVYSWTWKRAPGFFDVVAYTGTGANRTVRHNLTVPPEMMWVKGRSVTNDWRVYHKSIGNTNHLRLNEAVAASSEPYWNNTTPTSSVFSLNSHVRVNGSGNTYIAYLFSSLAGISKVGSFSHTSNTDTNVDCGFTSGARFVLIKESSGTGSWYVFDTVRGIVSGSDKALFLDNTSAQQTADWLDPSSTGFIVDGPNWGTGTYVFYAIA